MIHVSSFDVLLPEAALVVPHVEHGCVEKGSLSGDNNNCHKKSKQTKNQLAASWIRNSAACFGFALSNISTHVMVRHWAAAAGQDQKLSKDEMKIEMQIYYVTSASFPPSVPVQWLQQARAGSIPRPSPYRPCTPSWRPPRPSWPSCLIPSCCTPPPARSCGRALAMQSIPTSHGWKYSRVVLSTK